MGKLGVFWAGRASVSWYASGLGVGLVNHRASMGPPIKYFY